MRRHRREDIPAVEGGRDLGQLGPAITDPMRLPWPEIAVTATALQGEIIHVDRFGNLVSNVTAGVFHDWCQGRDFHLKVGPLTLTRLRRTYGEAAAGEMLALIGSHGYLEIACAAGSAAARLQAGPGLPLEIQLVE